MVLVFDDGTGDDLSQLSTALSQIDAETRSVEAEPQTAKQPVGAGQQAASDESDDFPRRRYLLRIT